MNLHDCRRSWLRSALGAVLATLCGLVLLETGVGDFWVNASYDYLFRFAARPITNKVVVIQMDNESYDLLHQKRLEPWDRALHVRLLERLADDGCPLVVFDSFFSARRNPASDKELAGAMQRQQGIVLMAEQAAMTHPALTGARPILPSEPFLSAAGTNWGVAWLDPDPDLIVRRLWPFPAPGPYPSLPWAAARRAGAQLDIEPHDQWLRYYGEHGTWTSLSYRFALTQPTNYYRDKIVFIGSQPQTSFPDSETDEFLTPYTRWTGETTGGVQIMVASFLNLVNGDWLRRLGWQFEVLLMVVAGSLLGGSLCRIRPLAAGGIAVGVSVIVGIVAVCASYYTNYWFPWLVIAGGQVPCALAWSVGTQRLSARKAIPLAADGEQELPNTPGYELLPPAIGHGSYGEVWLARNRAGRWHALKVVYLSKFNGDLAPYEREFNGVSRYRPISDKHPGLLRVDYVSEKTVAGYFYYVMELGDALEAGWQKLPATYRPRDLVNERTRTPGQKLPVFETVNVGLALADALDFLHRQGLTHRDIKPQNVIYVNGRPKLADIGLTAEIRPPEQTRTYVGTPGYLPPPPELPGTPQADIYALGMMLYVLCTGRHPAFFPEISTTLADSPGLPEFFHLNAVILKACHPDCAQRYKSSSEMLMALQEVHQTLSTSSATSLRMQHCGM